MYDFFNTKIPSGRMGIIWKLLQSRKSQRFVSTLMSADKCYYLEICIVIFCMGVGSCTRPTNAPWEQCIRYYTGSASIKAIYFFNASLPSKKFDQFIGGLTTFRYLGINLVL